jgi:hypothetical protein
MSNVHLALAFLTASYIEDEKPTVTHTVVAKAATVSRKVRAKSTGEVAAPSSDKVEPLSMPLPEKGSLDAKSFIVACRKAQSRDEVICAIAGYVGYDRRADFGSQEMLAKLQANRELRGTPAPSAPFKRSIIPSTAGFVAGVPDHNKRMLNDLKGRERLAAETRDNHVRDARNRERTWGERKLSIGLARVEQCRLEQIREDIARF